WNDIPDLFDIATDTRTGPDLARHVAWYARPRGLSKFTIACRRRTFGSQPNVMFVGSWTVTVPRTRHEGVFGRKESLHSPQTEFEEARASMNADFHPSSRQQRALETRAHFLSTMPQHWKWAQLTEMKR